MEQATSCHRGEVLERIIRKGPYSITTVAHKLGISRTTLYHKFKEYNLDYDFLLSVSDILHYDINREMPELDTKVTFSLEQQHQQARIREKQYLDLLERYRKLFSFLTKTTHQYGLDRIRDQIDKLAETNKL